MREKRKTVKITPKKTYKCREVFVPIVKITAHTNKMAHHLLYLIAIVHAAAATIIWQK